MSIKKKTAQDRLNFAWGIVTLAMLAAGGICAIVDRAVTGGLSWAQYPLGALTFAWIIVTPLLLGGQRRLPAALIALSLAIMPFLMFLSGLTGGGWAWPIGMPVSLVSLAVLWLALILFRYTRVNRWICGGLVALSALAINPVVHLALRHYDTTLAPGSALGNFIAIPCIALVLFVIGRRRATRRAA